MQSAMMELAMVATSAEALVPWIFPWDYPNAPRPIAMSIPCPVKLAELWKAINPAVDESVEVDHYLTPPSVNRRRGICDGIEHLHPGFLRALVAVPQAERWKFAKTWADLRHGRDVSADREVQAQYKRLFAELCALAEEALASDAFLVVARERFFDD